MPEDFHGIDPIEILATKAAEGMLQNAAAMENLAKSIRDIGVSQKRTILLAGIGVAVLLSLALIVVFYLIPISTNGNQQRVDLLDCITPSTPGHVHPCSDRQAKAGFDLITAEVRCTVNLDRLNVGVHTNEVRQCVADTLGVRLNPDLPQPNP